MPDAKAIVTLVFFLLSIFFILVPVRVYRGLKLDLATAPPLCVLILLASTCIPIEVVWDGIRGTDGIKPFNILILFFGLAYMSISLDLTGILQSAAFWVSNRGGTSGHRLYLYFFLFSVVLAIILGNDPVILSGTAFLVYFTKVAEVKPLSFLIAEFVGCNLGSMVLFVGNPTNVVLCEGFNLGYIDFSAWTLLPFLFSTAVGYAALLGQFHRRIPKTIIAPELDPRSVLIDPTGAIVGSVMILSCLILIIGVSFAGVEVWEIALPFAVAKALWDVAWDLYRSRRGTMPENIELKSRVKGDAPVSTTQERAPGVVRKLREALQRFHWRMLKTTPTFTTAFCRLPFPLLSFTFSQFMLVEALVYRGWTAIFAGWLSHLTINVPATIFSVGFISIVLCALAGTNILSTILVTKLLQQAPQALDDRRMRAASIALAVGSNVGAINAVFSASLAGLLWRTILRQKAIHMRTRDFARWNMGILPIVSFVGLCIVWAEVAVYYGKIHPA
ncbi:hypothetical protein PYCC9005_003052 [Savitreella phatthalungensis]